MKKNFLLALASILFILLLSPEVFGQANIADTLPQYKRMVLEATDQTKFSDIVDAAEDHFEGRHKGRGSGFKQYKRWEYFMRDRLDDDGTLLNYSAKVWQEYLKFIGEARTQSPAPGDNIIAPSAHTSGGSCLGPVWSVMGPDNYVNGNEGYNPGLGRINVIAFHPTDPDIIYFGAPSGGLWRTTNGGTTWTPLTDHLTSIGVSGIAIDPTDPDHIYILTGDGDARDTWTIGVLESTDAGATWSSTGLTYTTSQTEAGYKLLMDPTDPDVLLAAMTDGLFRTDDGGATWTQELSGTFRDIEFQPGNTDVVYATTRTSFFRSTDNGQSWSSVGTGLPGGTSRIEIGVTPDDPDYVYLLSGPATGPGRFAGVSRSTNSGTSFSLRIDTPNILGGSSNGLDDNDQAWYDLAVAVSPNDAEEVITGGINVWKSTDGANTVNLIAHWRIGTTTEYTHADIHELVYNPLDDKLYIGSDGGIFVSDDDGDTWTDLSDGIVITQFYRIAGTESNADLILGGTQDNGSNTWNGTNTITHIFGADGMDCMIDYTDEDILYYTTQRGGLRRSTDGGVNSSFIAPSGGPWVTPYGMDPDDPTILYGGWDTLYRSTNSGSSWTRTGMLCSNALAICQDDGTILYTAVGPSVFRSTNSGTSNGNISSGLPSRSITFLAINPNDCDEVWVSYGGFNASQKVYRTTDGGSSWTNMSSGLPNVPINSLYFVDEMENGGALGAVYAGTDIGVWYRDAGTPWTCVSDGLPNVPVFDMEFNYTDFKLRAGTYGRGLWEADGIMVTPPEAVCNDTTLELDGSGNLTVVPDDVDGGSSASAGIASRTVSPNTFDCSDVGMVTVTLTITDDNGNTDSCEATVTVEDNEPATATCRDTTIYLDNNGDASITPGDIDGGSTDNCGIQSLDASVTDFDCADQGDNVVILTVTDVNGNTASCASTVTVLDTTDPEAICKKDTVYLDTNGVAFLTASQFDGGSTDNCGIIDSMAIHRDSVTCENLAFNLVPPGPRGRNVIYLTVWDEAGNSSSCFAEVTVFDTTAPAPVCKDITVALDASGNANITGLDIDDGSTDNCAIVGWSVWPNSFTCADVGANTVILTVHDSSGNTATCASTVTVEDNTRPTALCKDITVQLDGSGQATITGTDIDDGSTDNCGIQSRTASQTVFDCSHLGANTVVLTVTDVNGNTATCTSTVTVEDNVPPVASCKDITVQLDANGDATITGADIDNGSTDNCAIVDWSASPNSFTCADVGANSVTLTVTDQSGNTASCRAIVTVEDNVPPVANCKDITVQLDGNGDAAITVADLNNGSTDNCNIQSLTASQTSFHCSDIGNNTVTLTVTDGEGNTSTCQSVVTVEDNVDPVAVCKDITVQLDANGEATITGADIDDGSFDNCNLVSWTASPDSFNASHLGTNTVVLTVTDQGGNTATCTSTVTVVDDSGPVALCKDITVQLGPNGWVFISGDDIDDGSYDNDGIYSLAASPNYLTCGDIGANTVVLTVTDVNGNTATCESTVTVEDNMAPTALCKDATAYLDANGEVTITGSLVDNGSYDNCPGISLSVSPSSFDCADVGANTVVLTVTDQSGNTATCSATVTVADTLPPVITGCPEDIALPRPGPAFWTPPTAGGSCGVTMTSTHNPGDHFPRGVTQVVYTATDPNGNTTTCTFNVRTRGGYVRKDSGDEPTDLEGSRAETLTLEIWPNPTTGKLHLDLSQDGYSGKVNIELYDLLGRKIHTTVNTLEDQLLQTLDIGHLAGGQYMLRIRMDASGEIITRKVIVLR